MKIKVKFIISCLFTGIWLLFCSILQYLWFISLKNIFGVFVAIFIIIGLATLPSIMIMFLITGIIIDKPKRYKIRSDLIDCITILIAAYNEENNIYNTLKSIYEQSYPEKVIVKVIDNNSKDNTKQEINRAIKDFNKLNNIEIEYLFERKQGKFAALNHGLKSTITKYVITIDADTFLYKNALLDIVNNMYIENQKDKIGAIAGTIFVKNSKVNLLTKIQYLEYLLSIASIKRMQGVYGSVLVAQGAFSIYKTELLNEIGSWKNTIGEDIVLTWELLSRNYKVYYADCAIAFTDIPEKFSIYAKQRARWARGMIEGFKHFSFKKCKNCYAEWFIFTDLFLFIIDFSIVFIFIPALIAALLFGNYLIVGWTTLLLSPVTILIFAIMYYSEYKRVYQKLKLKVSNNYFSFIFFLLFYSIIMSPICVWGYLQEFLKLKRIWK